jgi:RecJ-like exonuclease
VTLPFDLDGQSWQVPAEAVGVGEPAPDYPLLVAIVGTGDVYQCPRCEATWVADRPEWCGWCCRNWVSMQRAQRMLDLMEPEWEHSAMAWVARLGMAVEAGRLTPEEVVRAVSRYRRGRVREGAT